MPIYSDIYEYWNAVEDARRILSWVQPRQGHDDFVITTCREKDDGTIVVTGPALINYYKAGPQQKACGDIIALKNTLEEMGCFGESPRAPYQVSKYAVNIDSNIGIEVAIELTPFECVDSCDYDSCSFISYSLPHPMRRAAFYDVHLELSDHLGMLHPEMLYSEFHLLWERSKAGNSAEFAAVGFYAKPTDRFSTSPTKLKLTLRDEQETSLLPRWNISDICPTAWAADTDPMRKQLIRFEGAGRITTS